MNKELVLAELESARAKLLDIVNNGIDGLISRIEYGESIDSGDPANAETVYPLSTTPALFKGTKPTAVFFGEEKVAVKTWRKAYTLILQRCADIPEKRDKLMGLRGRISGRSRFFLSGKPDGMDTPIKIAEGLYVEGYFDTELLLRILTTEFLDIVRFDYSDISVAVTTAKPQGNDKERRANYSRAYREANREKINAYQRDYHAKRKNNKAVDK
jgi:hypothetical protein